MKKVSIVVPLYNGEKYIASTLKTLVGQTYQDIEIIVVNDASTDDSLSAAESVALRDDRVRILSLAKNAGTLAARKAGIIASTGDYVMLIDQDDELVDDAVFNLVEFAEKVDFDIYHFTAVVIPENDAARNAAAGMQRFLTPPTRILARKSILAHQFLLKNGFDWQLHHKMYKGDLARKAYACASDERLVLSDDFYLSFIIDAFAESYCAIPHSRWYRYYLGRGDTLGKQMTGEAIIGISDNNSKALRLVKEFVSSSNAPQRDDWENLVNDATQCLLDYPINEWKDSLDRSEQMDILAYLLNEWPHEHVCAELWRFARDTAYAFLMNNRDGSQLCERLKEEACYYRDVAFAAERCCTLADSNYWRYREMKAKALNHLQDSGLLPSRHSNRKRGRFDNLVAKHQPFNAFRED